MMLVFPTDLRWNDLPMQAVWVPYVCETMRYLAARSEKKAEYRVGEQLSVPAGWAISGPDGKEVQERPALAVLPGFYSIRPKEGAQGAPMTVAVNRDPDEADTESMVAEELVAAAQRSPGGAEAGATPGKTGQAEAALRDRNDTMWWYILLAVGAMGLAELILSNRALRH
jgi:hypothetical protein